jgi:uncharacterized protein YndB with AHSA1/START domain
MTNTPKVDPVVKTIDVPCPPETAFRIFTADFAAWWPKESHSVSTMSGGQPARSVMLEPGVGGALGEVAHDGTAHTWGSISVWEPPARLSFLWHVRRPVEQATVVDVTFEAEGTGTRVTLTHRGWEVLGDKAAETRDDYDAGWVHVFETCFLSACTRSAV